MRSITINLYSAMELSRLACTGDVHPDAFKRAHRNYIESLDDDTLWYSETVESMRALFSLAGVPLREWSVGVHGRSWARAGDFREEELKGPRAMAWLENHVFGRLRIPFAGDERWRLAKHGSYYRPGMVEPCPLTGFCADDGLLDSLRASVAKGYTLKEAFEALGDRCGEFVYDEYEGSITEESFIEHAEANGWEFDGEGNLRK